MSHLQMYSPMRKNSGSVNVFVRPPLGICHTRILASSQADRKPTKITCTERRTRVHDQALTYDQPSVVEGVKGEVHYVCCVLEGWDVLCVQSSWLCQLGGGEGTMSDWQRHVNSMTLRVLHTSCDYNVTIM